MPGGLVVLKLVATAGLVGAGVLFRSDPLGVLLCGVAAVAIGLYALRDLLAPVRLAADTEGVTVVAGFASRYPIAWREIERIRIDERNRLGLRTTLLEIDTGSSLHLFSSGELGAPVEEVAETLRHLRTGR